MKGRAQLRHVLLDTCFKDKPKVMDLEVEFTPLARLLFLDLLAAMSAATDARISRGVARALGIRIGLSAEKTDAIVEWCLSNEMLLLEEGQLSNARVIADQEAYFQKKLRDEQEAARKRNARGTSGGRPADVQRTSGGNSADDPGKRAGFPDYDIDTDPVVPKEGGAGGSPPRLQLSDSDVAALHIAYGQEPVDEELPAMEAHLRKDGRPPPDDPLAFAHSWMLRQRNNRWGWYGRQQRDDSKPSRRRKTAAEENIDVVQKVIREEAGIYEP